MHWRCSCKKLKINEFKVECLYCLLNVCISCKLDIAAMARVLLTAPGWKASRADGGGGCVWPSRTRRITYGEIIAPCKKEKKKKTPRGTRVNVRQKRRRTSTGFRGDAVRSGQTFVAGTTRRQNVEIICWILPAACTRRNGGDGQTLSTRGLTIDQSPCTCAAAACRRSDRLLKRRRVKTRTLNAVHVSLCSFDCTSYYFRCINS